MRLQSSETALVIAGAWNSAILTPEWVMRHCLGAQPGAEQRVQAEIPAGFAGTFDFPRFTIGDFSYTARPDALIISPARSSEANIQIVEALARQALETLSHTPIGGMGHNFEFLDEHPDPAVLEVFTRSHRDLSDVAPVGWQVQSSAIGTAFQVEGRTVNLQRIFRDGRLTVKFNFHHQVANAQACASIIRREHGEASMYQNLAIAKQLVEDIYGGLDEQDELQAGA